MTPSIHWLTDHSPITYTDPPSPPYGLLSLAQFTLSMFHHIFVSPQPNIIFKLRILFQNSSTIFTFRRQWTKVTYHLLSTIWPFVPHKPYIFWKLMTRPIQITSSSAIHQLPISSPLVVTNNDDIVQNLIQFLVQNSHSLLLSSFTNNYIVGSWTFNPPKCKTPFFQVFM